MLDMHLSLSASHGNIYVARDPWTKMTGTFFFYTLWPYKANRISLILSFKKIKQLFYLKFTDN